MIPNYKNLTVKGLFIGVILSNIKFYVLFETIYRTLKYFCVFLFVLFLKKICILSIFF